MFAWLSSRRLAEVHVEGVTLRTVQPPQLVHMVVVVVAGYGVGQRGIRVVYGGDQLAETWPLVETEGHTPLGGLYLAFYVLWANKVMRYDIFVIIWMTRSEFYEQPRSHLN